MLGGHTASGPLFIANRNLENKNSLYIMKLNQITVIVDALSLSFFNSEQTVGNTADSSLSHAARQPAWGETEEGWGPNWCVTGRMLSPPSQMGVTVTAASVNAQNLVALWLLSVFGHSPQCCIYLFYNSTVKIMFLPAAPYIARFVHCLFFSWR